MNFNVSIKTDKYPIKMFTNKILTGLKFKDFTLSIRSPNHICLLKNGGLAIIKKIDFHENIQDELSVQVCLYHDVEAYFTTPCDSRHVGIYKVSSTSIRPPIYIPINSIKRKCMLLFSETENVVITLLHNIT